MLIFAKYAWAVLRTQVSIVIVLALFGVSETPFQKAVIAGLILIYSGQIATSTELFRSNVLQSRATAAIRIRVLRAVNAPGADEMEEDIKEAFLEYDALTGR